MASPMFSGVSRGFWLIVQVDPVGIGVLGEVQEKQLILPVLFPGCTWRKTCHVHFKLLHCEVVLTG